MRGTEKRIDGTAAAVRITPAGAGNSLSVHIPKYPTVDHPRRCGEQQWILANRSASAGSPPQVRGTANGLFYRESKVRITPAGAGNRG